VLEPVVGPQKKTSRTPSAHDFETKTLGVFGRLATIFGSQYRLSKCPSLTLEPISCSNMRPFRHDAPVWFHFNFRRIHGYRVPSEPTFLILILCSVYFSKFFFFFWPPVRAVSLAARANFLDLQQFGSGLTCGAHCWRPRSLVVVDSLVKLQQCESGLSCGKQSWLF
jgi:hypothetical protein